MPHRIKGSARFRNTRSLGCSHVSAVRCYYGLEDWLNKCLSQVINVLVYSKLSSYITKCVFFFITNYICAHRAFMVSDTETICWSMWLRDHSLTNDISENNMFKSLIPLHQVLWEEILLFPHCRFQVPHPGEFSNTEKMILTQSLICTDWPKVIDLITLYLIVIFDDDISSLLNKAFHCEVTAFASCNVQSSLLIEKKTPT